MLLGLTPSFEPRLPGLRWTLQRTHTQDTCPTCLHDFPLETSLSFSYYCVMLVYFPPSLRPQPVCNRPCLTRQKPDRPTEVVTPGANWAAPLVQIGQHYWCKERRARGAEASKEQQMAEVSATKCTGDAVQGIPTAVSACASCCRRPPPLLPRHPPRPPPLLPRHPPRLPPLLPPLLRLLRRPAWPA